MDQNLRATDLNLLPVFDALMREENLSRAAHRLGMSQPAMSAALQRLRLTLKDELFVRTRQGMIPTPRARALHPQIQQALDLIRQAVNPREAFDPRTSRRTFHVLANDYFETVGYGRLLARLQSESPALTARLSPVDDGDLVARLRRMEADVVLDYVKIDSALVEVQQIATETLVVIAREGHPRIGDSLSMEQYLAERHVLLPLRTRERSQLELALGGQSLSRRVAATVQHFSAMPAVVGETDLLATLPASLWRRFGRSFGVQCLPFPGPIPPVPVWMMWPGVLTDDPGHTWFRGVLQDLALDFT